MDFDDWEIFDCSHADEILTREELKKRVDEEWDLMNEIEKSGRIRNGDPTFLEYVLSLMNNQNSNKVELNELTKQYKIHKNN